MYLIAGILGALLGARTAKKKNGNTADILQYGAVYFLIFAIIAFIITLILDRTVI